MTRQRLVAPAVLLVATLAVSWPWLSGRRVFAMRDTAFTLIELGHLQDAILGRASLWDGPLGHPLPDRVPQADWMLGEAVLGLPLRALSPLDQHAVLVVLGLFLTAWAVERVAAALLGEGPHTWVAGIVGGLGPMQLAHAQHVNLVHHELAVLGPLLLAAGLARDRAGPAALGGALGVGGAHLGWYVGVHGLVALAGVALVAALARKGGRRSWAAAAVGALVAGATVLPVALRYAAFADAHAVGLTAAELQAGSWMLADTLRPLPGVALHRPLAGIVGALPTLGLGGMNPPNPGYLAALLAVLGAWRVRRGGWGWAAVGVVTVVALLLALGPLVSWRPDLPLLPGPHQLVPALDALRAPGRWLALAFLGVGVLAAAGTRALPAWAAPVVAGVALLETASPPTVPRESVELPPIYSLAAGGEGLLWDERLVAPQACGCGSATPLLGALVHRRPLLGGQYGRHVPELAALDEVLATWPSEEAVARLRTLGVTQVIDHPRFGTDGEGCVVRGGHRLCAVPAAATSASPPTD